MVGVKNVPEPVIVTPENFRAFVKIVLVDARFTPVRTPAATTAVAGESSAPAEFSTFTVAPFGTVAKVPPGAAPATARAAAAAFSEVLLSVTSAAVGVLAS